MRISGSVKNLDSGEFLGHVNITGTIAGDRIFETNTDGHGDFRYQDQRTQFVGRRIAVRAELTGFKPQEKEATVPPGDLALSLELSPEVPPRLVISGSVRDSNTGQPIANAIVRVSISNSPVFSQPTNSEGTFRQEVDSGLIGQVLTIRIDHADYDATETRCPLTAASLNVEIALMRKAAPTPPSPPMVKQPKVSRSGWRLSVTALAILAVVGFVGAQLYRHSYEHTHPASNSLPHFAGKWQMVKFTRDSVPQPPSSTIVNIPQNGREVVIGNATYTIASDGIITLRLFYAQDAHFGHRVETEAQANLVDTITWRVDRQLLVRETVSEYRTQYFDHPPGTTTAIATFQPVQ
jgi:hypothetical protein